MKNNRALDVTDTLIKEHKLSTSPPPKDSLFWNMWNACTQIAHQALETDFIQGIKSGSLDPVVYGSFNVSDAYYCFNGADDYLIAQQRADNETLKAFLLKKHQGYLKYNKTFTQTWYIKDAEKIIPSDVCKRYSDFESSVASNDEPIYCLIVMIPCEYLWTWLAAQLHPPIGGNLYAPWINGNHNPGGAYAMGNFLNDYQKSYPIDEDKAIHLYTQAMMFEQQNFAEATPS